MTSFFIQDDDASDTERKLTGYRLIPNVITICALCAGLTAVRFASVEMWGLAVGLIFISALLDLLDGAMARLLNATSRFGAQLDSLSDFVSFGVAPALMLFFWQLDDARVIGWLSAMLLCVAVALRLARFNVQSEQASRRKNHSELSDKARYFEGVPAPAGAICALLPLYLAHSADSWLYPLTYWQRDLLTFAPYGVAVWCLLIAGLMVSRLPSFSLKGVRLPARYMVPVMAGVVLILSLVISQPWEVLTFGVLGYLASMILSYRRLKRESRLFMSLDDEDYKVDSAPIKAKNTGKKSGKNPTRKPAKKKDTPDHD